MSNNCLLLSNVFLSASFITLAKNHAGCMQKDENGNFSVIDEVCDKKVYGFKPSSFITNIAAIAGVLVAFLLPFIGAIVDYTRYRKLIGCIAAALVISIQTIQIGTVEATWFFMTILQAINGFLSQCVRLAAFSYLPEIHRIVGDRIMPQLNTRFFILAACASITYLVLVAGSGFLTKTFNNDVKTAQIGQAVDMVVSGIFYALGFYFFTKKEPRRELPENESLFFAGFKQVFFTARGIWRHYRSTLGWFFLAVIFARTATISFLVIVVTLLIEVMKFSGIASGAAYLVVLFFTVPGSFFARFLMSKKDSIFCIRLSLIVFIGVNFAGFLTMTGPEVSHLVWLFAALWGFMMGWFFPTEVNIYSSLMPKGQEAEFAGFFLYCSQVLGWFPSLIFTIINERGNWLGWGGLQLNIYLFLSLMCYFMMPSWNECAEITRSESKIVRIVKTPPNQRKDDSIDV